MKYFSKWVEAYALTNQNDTTLNKKYYHGQVFGDGGL